MKNDFDIMMIEIEKELLALKTAKRTAGSLENYVFTYQDTTSNAGTHYKITYGAGNQPIFVTFTCPRASVFYVFRTPENNIQYLDVYDTTSGAQTTYTLASARPILSIEKL